MSFPEAIALCAIIIGLIAGAGMWLDAHNSRLRHRTKELELKARMAKAEGSAGSSRIGEMENRLRVLERIATDRSPDLAREIEDLRGSARELEKQQ